MTKPLSLRGFIRQSGGLWESPGGMTGELRHLRQCCPGLVNSKRGRPLDRAREAAAEAGYLGADTATAVADSTIQDFLDAVYSDTPVYSVFDENYVFEREAREQQRERKRLLREYSYADETGLVEAADELNAFEYLADGGAELAATSPSLPKAPAPQDRFERLGRWVAASPITKTFRKIARPIFALPDGMLCLAIGVACGAVLHSSLMRAE
jgi:hypothetical protein